MFGREMEGSKDEKERNNNPDAIFPFSPLGIWDEMH